MKDFSLKEAALLCDSGISTLRKHLNANPACGTRVYVGEKPEWRMSHTQINEYLNFKNKNSKSSSYSTLVAEWVDCQASGLYYSRPLRQNTIAQNLAGLTHFWNLLERRPNAADITPDTVNLALSRIAVEHDDENCHYTQRANIYKAVRSFIKFLTAKRLRPPGAVDLFNRVRPVRLYQPKRLFFTQANYDAAIAANETMSSGRTASEVFLGKLLISLIFFAGFRRNELLNLKIEDIDFNNTAFVFRGKGGKTRTIPIDVELQPMIDLWLEKYRPDSDEPYLIVNRFGAQYSQSAIRLKLTRIGKKAGFHIHPHAIRRGFATEWLEAGATAEELTPVMGHSTIAVLERSYLNNSGGRIANKMKLGRRSFQDAFFEQPTAPVPELPKPKRNLPKLFQR